ncbi:hypothetical protein [Bradyrhizobium viridifuturi]|uniref:hypothetical protein n=1 Tax=Bradyrhizobium viridifuturi TaxID=1654716 RepID=UPI000FE147E5|nr:hypothetical protein [Bradyrhizobium viridifuturi]
MIDEQIDSDETIGLGETVVDQGKFVSEADEADRCGRRSRPEEHGNGCGQVGQNRCGPPSAIDDIDGKQKAHQARKQRQAFRLDVDLEFPEQEAGETARRDADQP